MAAHQVDFPGRQNPICDRPPRLHRRLPYRDRSGVFPAARESATARATSADATPRRRNSGRTTTLSIRPASLGDKQIAGADRPAVQAGQIEAAGRIGGLPSAISRHIAAGFGVLFVAHQHVDPGLCLALTCLVGDRNDFDPPLRAETAEGARRSASAASRPITGIRPIRRTAGRFPALPPRHRHRRRPASHGTAVGSRPLRAVASGPWPASRRRSARLASPQSGTRRRGQIPGAGGLDGGRQHAEIESLLFDQSVQWKFHADRSRAEIGLGYYTLCGAGVVRAST